MIKRWDIVLFAALLLVAGALALVFFHDDGSVLVVEHDGEVLARVQTAELLEVERLTFETENGVVTVCVSSDGAWIESSDCPNRQCVHSGKITQSGQSVICLPMRFSIYFTKEGNGEPDGITG